jgi:molecular chaperone DnaK (HSP70)
MNLYKKIYKIKSNNHQLKEVDIELIIKLMLIEVKKKAIEQIKKTYPSLIEKNYRFIITVPAIWDYKSKQIMIDAANKAGLFKENDDIGTFFALEPEAASIYFNTQESYKNIINNEQPFILCDLGSDSRYYCSKESYNK